jgi:putative hemolysin
MMTSLWASTQFTLDRVPHYLRLKGLGSSILSPHIQIDFENDYYQVKTINDVEELTQVLKLRYNVFFREFATTEPKFSLLKIDVDVHDFICDHLIVKDKETDSVVACYRLLPSSLKRGFYSEGEFDLSELLKLDGDKLELGRACVDPEHRSGVVISLLWKGMLEYARRAKVRYLFGCSSINGKDFPNYQAIMSHLEKNDCFLKDIEITARGEFSTKDFLLPPQDKERKGKVIGSLLNMYLMAGAKVARDPAYDAQMDCLDLLTVMDMTKMPPSFERRFSC